MKKIINVNILRRGEQVALSILADDVAISIRGDSISVGLDQLLKGSPLVSLPEIIHPTEKLKAKLIELLEHYKADLEGLWFNSDSNAVMDHCRNRQQEVQQVIDGLNNA